ncbi:peptidase S41, partial [bacterium]|nr:peptidase S41 [bacterium]
VEQAGLLHLLDPQTMKATTLPITVNADLLETRPRWARGAKWVRDASLSPSGARVALEFRGEIVTVPAEKGDPRYLTNTTGAHERGPAWSPDGKEIAYVSDESGEYELVVRSQDGKGAPRRIQVPGSGFYDRLAWSPDGKKIALTDNSWSLWVVDVATGTAKKVASEKLYAPQKTIRPSWSPDSRWVAYTLGGPTYVRTLHVYDVVEQTSFPLTDGLSDVSDPVFDKGGKLLWFLASTDAGPARNWFSLNNQDVDVTRAIYVATLKAGTPSPLAKESDEEKGPDSKDAGTKEKKDEGIAGKGDDGKAGKDAKKAEPKKVDPVVIDRDGFSLRIVDLPVPAADISALSSPNAGEIWFLRRADGKTALQKWDTKSRKAETIAPEADDYEVSFDGKKLLTRVKESWSVGPAGKKGDAKPGDGDGRLKIDAVQVRVDPRAEWPEIFDEVWRINRDYFYDPGMHGRDWKAMKAKY